MKTRKNGKKLTLNKKTIADLSFDRMRKLRGGVAPCTSMCYTLATLGDCCTVVTNCSCPVIGTQSPQGTAPFKCPYLQKDPVDTDEC